MRLITLADKINPLSPQARGLVGCWPLNDGAGTIARDVVGRNNSALSGFTTTTRPPSPVGISLRFEGAQYINTGKNMLTFFSASLGSFSCLVRPISAGNAVANVYLGKVIFGSNLDAARYFGLYQASVGGNDRIWVWAWDSAERRVGIPYIVGQWIHVAWVHNGGVLYAYANGVMISSTALGNIGGDYQVGIGGLTTGQYFSGDIADVRIYNRALSADEIRDIYAHPQDLYQSPRQIILPRGLSVPQTVAASSHWIQSIQSSGHIISQVHAGGHRVW